MLNKIPAQWNLGMEALNLIDKWLYKRVSRNDLPIKDQNFTILCIEVTYSMKPVPNVKMLVNKIVISQWPLFVQRWHVHSGLITTYKLLLMNFFDNQGITSNLSHD